MSSRQRIMVLERVEKPGGHCRLNSRGQWLGVAVVNDLWREPDSFVDRRRYSDNRIIEPLHFLPAADLEQAMSVRPALTTTTT